MNKLPEFLQPQEINNPETSQENEKEPSIRLEFLRHEEKEEAEVYDQLRGKISVRGRQHAKLVGQEKNPQPNIGLAYGSPRLRSTESAMRQLLANQKEITPDMTWEEIEELVKQKMKVGKKTIETTLLDFKWSGEFNRIGEPRYKKGEVVDFMFYDSDNLVRKLKDLDSTCYIRSAGNIALIIEKYIKILPQWRKVVENDQEKYQGFDNELQRFLGSHGSVPESFILKIIEKMEGKKVAEESIGTLIKHKGFVSGEGFSVKINSADKNDINVEITCQNKRWVVPASIIAEIIAERNKFDEEIEQSINAK